jgi:hypothetical protein
MPCLDDARVAIELYPMGFVIGQLYLIGTINIHDPDSASTMVSAVKNDLTAVS